MSGLSEAELHVQAMRLVCEALQDREQDGLEVDWDVIRQMHNQMDAMLQDLGHKHRYDSSEIVDLRKDRDHWKQARQDAHEAGELMRAEIERLQAFVGKVRKVYSSAHPHNWMSLLRPALAKLDAGTEPAPVAEPARCPESERLQAFVSQVRSMVNTKWYTIEVRTVRELLAQLDAGTEPTPVAEPLDAEGVQ